MIHEPPRRFGGIIVGERPALANGVRKKIQRLRRHYMVGEHARRECGCDTRQERQMPSRAGPFNAFSKLSP